MRRAAWLWAAAVAAGSLLALWSVAQRWASADMKGMPAAYAEGGMVAGGLQAVALAALAGVVAVLATKGAGRQVVGAVIALCGAGLAVLVWRGVTDAGLSAWARGEALLMGLSGYTYTVMPLWPSVAALGAALVLAGGGAAVVRGRSWGGMSARYRREAGPEEVKGERALWDAMDRGDDPTR
jgi:uncharacterized membrane protein (TIGR02234 family)